MGNIEQLKGSRHDSTLSAESSPSSDILEDGKRIKRNNVEE
jgi:hypothetical protein